MQYEQLKKKKEKKKKPEMHTYIPRWCQLLDFSKFGIGYMRRES
jgi:hypothetical protein